MFFFLKNILPAVVTALFTYFYFSSFYGEDRELLWVVVLFGVVFSLLISLPKTKRTISFLLFLVLPFFAVYIFTHNLLAFILCSFISLIFAGIMSKRQEYTKIVFTEASATVFIKHSVKKSFFSISRNVFCVMLTAVAAIMLLFPSSGPLWKIKAFPIKLTSGEVIQQNVVPLGNVTGIAWYDPTGLLVDSFYEIDHHPSPAFSAGLLAGDIITKINGEDALTSAFITHGADANPAVLTVNRLQADGGYKEHNITVTPLYSQTDSAYRIGITYYQSAFVSSSVQTMTFAHKDDHLFAATAHSSEEIYPASQKLTGVVFSAIANGKTESGLSAALEKAVGLTSHTDRYGTYGVLDTVSGEEIPLGEKWEFSLGRATLLSSFEGGDVKEYEVYITGTYRIDDRDVLCVYVSDPAIKSFGGIARGMSGSPIIQNGKLIGALSNMEKGGEFAYATFARDMAHSLQLGSLKGDNV